MIMKRIFTIFLTLFVASSVWAQTNYTVTFSANVEMDKVQVTNTVSGETKTLYMPDNVITLQKNKKQGTAVETVDNSAFLQQTGENTVVINMEKAGHLNLTLYSMNGTFVARYSNNVDAGPNAFKIGAVSGVYVLVASENNQTASLKIMLTQNSQPSILEILTTKPESMLKSIDDVITFDEGDEFEFTGYYKNQTDVKTAVITENKQIVFVLNSEPSVNSTQPMNVLHTTATVGGNVTNDNGAAVTERGVCWATTDNPTISDNKEICGDGVGEFSVSLTELSDATTYYVRAYALNEIGVTYGEIISFTTKTISVPSVSSANISNVSNSSVTVEGAIEDENGAAIIEQGICWAATDNPTISDNKLAADIKTGIFSLSLTSLANGTTYYVRTYAVNSIGIAYGETVSFTTTDIPVVATASVKDILYTTATIDGNVTLDNGAIVTERGVCWSTAENPTVDDNKVTSGTGTGAFSVSLTGLTDATTYYACAYAINNVGTAYGEIVSFTTKEITIPTLSTTNATKIEFKSATVGGNVTNDNGAAVTERGVCWATTDNPTIFDNKEICGDGKGEFWVSLTELADATTYYVRAYAINEVGIAYGEISSFTTKTIAVPTVSSAHVIEVSESSVTIEGTIVDDNGATVIERGVCWATTENPTISNNKVVANNESTSFSLSITGLEIGTIYYVRAYAINSVGVAYGDQILFVASKYPIVNGAIQAEFSVSKTKKVYFSQGNLQYQASTGLWRFAEKQYDMIGRYNENISSKYSGWIDLFGWGTSGWVLYPPYAYSPCNTSMENSDYYILGNYKNNLTGDYASADWGVYNKISNGGNQAGMWRTLTYSEWIYLISGRAQASSLKGLGRVNNVRGLILLPDGWETPPSVRFTSASNYSPNVYSLEEWAVMESYGAVFLPAAGYRYGKDVYDVGSSGYYWSSSTYNKNAYFLKNKGMDYCNRAQAQSVRLVQDVE